MRLKIVCSLALTLVITHATFAAEASLVDAVKQKNATAVKALLLKRVDVNAPEGDGATALHWAVYRDDLEMVNLLIGAGAKVNVANDLEITPLALAAANGNEAIVERLLKAGAFPDAASEAGVTPLMQAARTGNPGAVRSLVEHEANVNAKENDRQQTPLMWAASQGHAAAVKILLDHGADVKAKTRVRNMTIVDSSAPRIKASKDGAKLTESGGSTALVFAALSGDPESARLLIAAGANPNEGEADGNSALVLAAFNGNGPVASILLDAGADPNAAGAGYTALHAAAMRGDLQTVKKLLAKGADPNALMTKGSPVRRFGSQWALVGPMIGATPLFVAASYLEVDIVRALAAAGANPTIALQNGVTPLLVAAGSPVERAARPSDLIRFNVPDEDSPAIPRREPDVLESLRILLDAGSDVNQVSSTGDTAMHSAASAGMLTVIQLLADRGAKLDVKNRQGQTPLALTAPRGGRGGQVPNPENAAKAKAAEDLLRKLGATP
jgi:ankyrin repeat protein